MSFEGNENTQKPSSKVLRPPGGGSSDIFGGDLPQTPRSVKNHMQSSIFSCEKDIKNNGGDNPRRAQKNVDSYQRLFGEPERPVTPAKNHMKSNIPFGAKTEAAQALISNSNGNGNGHYNGKSGSVSSTSSSVSSSNENLRMNGFSKTDQTSPRVASNKIESTDWTGSQVISDNCGDKSKVSELAFAKIQESNIDYGAGDISSQTHNVTKCNTTNLNSLTTTTNFPHNRQESLYARVMDKASTANNSSRNPITGMGLNGDGVGGLKPLKPKCRRDGNPVTGEGYKSVDFNHTPSMNGANQIINKNRIPPGGYSSGLW